MGFLSFWRGKLQEDPELLTKTKFQLEEMKVSSKTYQDLLKNTLVWCAVPRLMQLLILYVLSENGEKSLNIDHFVFAEGNFSLESAKQTNKAGKSQLLFPTTYLSLPNTPFVFMSMFTHKGTHALIPLSPACAPDKRDLVSSRTGMLF